MTRDELIDFVRKEAVVPYGHDDTHFSWTDWGYMHCGIGDYWVWNEERLNSATDTELWELIAICSIHWKNRYEKWYDESDKNRKAQDSKIIKLFAIIEDLVDNSQRLDKELAESNADKFPVSWEDASESSYAHVCHVQLIERLRKEFNV